MTSIHFHLKLGRALCWIAGRFTAAAMWFNTRALAASERAQRLMDAY